MIIELMMVESYQIKMQMIIVAVNKYPTVVPHLPGEGC